MELTDFAYDVFICHASEDKEGFVRPLAERLRDHGLAVWYDEHSLTLGDRLSAAIDLGLLRSRYGVVVLSPTFLSKHYPRAELGGLLSRENSTGQKVILPVWHGLSVEQVRSMSPILADKLAISSSLGLERVAWEILRVCRPAGAPEPVAAVEAGPRPDHDWFVAHRTHATAGLQAAGLNGYMEVTMSLERTPPPRNQRELRSAAEGAEILTLGWPIGVVLSGRDEFRPRSRSDGIEAEVANPGRAAYDYWALRTNGDFYLLASLFDDLRRPHSIFFDVRIVRVTETLLHAHRLYMFLWDDAALRVRITVRHGGLRNRILRSVGSRYDVHEWVSVEDESESSITCALSDLQRDVVGQVKALVAPLLMVFDFFELPDALYDKIVMDFVREADPAWPA